VVVAELASADMELGVTSLLRCRLRSEAPTSSISCWWSPAGSAVAEVLPNLLMYAPSPSRCYLFHSSVRRPHAAIQQIHVDRPDLDADDMKYLLTGDTVGDFRNGVATSKSVSC
jgi:hypothetical protein